MKDLPLVLLDLGVERRCREEYGYDNSIRTAYRGYLLQYTLRGCGIYQTLSAGSAPSAIAAKRSAAPQNSAADPFRNMHALSPGKGFFSRMPEESRYFLPGADAAFGDAGLPDTADGSLDAEWEFFYLHFDGPAAAAFYETVRALSGPVFSMALTCPPVHLFFQLFEQCRRGNSLALYEGSEFLYRFLIQLIRELETPSVQGSALIRRACACLKEQFATISGIGEAAEICGVSQAHLTRAFRAETGQTPLQYLTRLRIEHGLFLLLNTGDSIEKIAAACGFLNGNYFAKVFRRYLNCSPEEYRRQNR